MTTSSERTVFTCYSRNLIGLLNDIHDGKIQLPDFQRDWVWDDKRICDLVASVSLSYPIGAILLLKINTDKINLKRRAIEGAPEGNNSPIHLILDGQQRLTSLYISLFSSRAVPVKRAKGNKKEKRLFYLDIEKCLNLSVERDDAIISISKDKKRRGSSNILTHDINDKEKEYEGKIFPLNIVTKREKVDNWFDGCNDYYRDKEKYDINKGKLNFFRRIVDSIPNHQVPIIELDEETPKEAICKVFVSVNQGGVELKTFELKTAMYAAEESNFSLRDDWEKAKEKLNEHADSKSILNAVNENSFIQAITLLNNHKSNSEKIPGCKNKDVLNLTLNHYKKNKEDIVKGFKNAALLLGDEKISNDMLPYETQLIPLAVICAAFGNRLHDEFTKTKIKQWYWHGVFSEAYAGSIETQFSNDIFQMYNWIENNEKPPMFQEIIDIGRVLRARTRNSAVYKGVIALLDKEGSKDFITEYETTNMIKSVGVDVHHIFPRKYCKEQKLDENKFESVVNKTRILPETNKKIAGKAPSIYLKEIQKEYNKDEEDLKNILKTHSIDYNFLIKDNFEGFILDRAKKLLKLIENVVGKPVVPDDEEIKEIFDNK